jgi:polysaccharide deacetylase family protein (PEP-CTERM system associated)
MTGGAAIVNAMTVDVEEHFQVSAFDRVIPRAAWESFDSRVERNTHRLLDLFDEFGVRATFFVLGWVARQRPALVREIDRRGHEVASHGYGHCLVYQLSAAEFDEDVRRAKALLEDASGQRVVGYRAPSYSITARSLWALDVLAQAGYEYDSSIFPIRHDRYGMPGAPRHAFTLRLAASDAARSGQGLRLAAPDAARSGQGEARSIIEIPPSTVQVGGVTLPASGGGYFRLLPYAWTRWSLARINAREGRPAVFYLHPWEIDPDQPRIRAGLVGRFRHYTNLRQTESRLRRLLGEFRFAPMSHLLSAQSESWPAVIDLAPAAAALGRVG